MAGSDDNNSDDDGGDDDRENKMLAIVDSGSSRTIINSDTSKLFIRPIKPNHQSVSTAAVGGHLYIDGSSIINRDYPVILFSTSIRRSVISVSDLLNSGYLLDLQPDGGSILTPDQRSVPLRLFRSGIWLVDTEDLFRGLIRPIGHFNALANAHPDIDKLDLLHRRTGYTSHQLLREAIRNGLVTGMTLERKYFSDRARRKFKEGSDTCAKAKITRLSFPQQQERVKNLNPGD
jgi:predicted DNA-binding protein